MGKRVRDEGGNLQRKIFYLISDANHHLLRVAINLGDPPVHASTAKVQRPAVSWTRSWIETLDHLLRAADARCFA